MPICDPKENTKTQVVFDSQKFRRLYPQFTKEGLSDDELGEIFHLATLQLDNSHHSPVPYDPSCGIHTRQILLYLLVAHLSTLSLWQKDGQSGPLRSASQGTVTATFSTTGQVGSESYYRQTPLGNTFWQAVRPYLFGGRYYGPPSDHRHPWG
ncbi:MAG: DUF4054 domain-containing protein [Candidatus Adiutrix sp.]